MKVVCISDTHGLHNRMQVPDGDVLVHAGDLTMRGKLDEVAKFGGWLAALPHKHKIVIAGNHDWAFERSRAAATTLLGTGVHYLQEEVVTIEGKTFYGAPWQPEFGGWAFNLPRDGYQLRKVWEKIPRETDVLITHGPPYGLLDRCPCAYTGEIVSVGDAALLRAVKRVKPKLHVFGHIHEGYGQVRLDETTFVNASSCTRQYRPDNIPIVIDL